MIVTISQDGVIQGVGFLFKKYQGVICQKADGLIMSKKGASLYNEVHWIAMGLIEESLLRISYRPSSEEEINWFYHRCYETGNFFNSSPLKVYGVKIGYSFQHNNKTMVRVEDYVRDRIGDINESIKVEGCYKKAIKTIGELKSYEYKYVATS